MNLEDIVFKIINKHTEMSAIKNPFVNFKYLAMSTHFRNI